MSFIASDSFIPPSLLHSFSFILSMNKVSQKAEQSEPYQEQPIAISFRQVRLRDTVQFGEAGKVSRSFPLVSSCTGIMRQIAPCYCELWPSHSFIPCLSWKRLIPSSRSRWWFRTSALLGGENRRVVLLDRFLHRLHRSKSESHLGRQVSRYAGLIRTIISIPSCV
jgi:hypothetical protein